MSAVKLRRPNEEPELRRRPSVESPAIRELLDHLARELAKEYVQLMEEAAADERPQLAPFGRRAP